VLEESKLPENRLIFGPKVSKRANSPERPQISLKSDAAVLLALNIPSYMGGASDPWLASRGKVGVVDKAGKKIPDFGPQNIGDGQIEFLSFGSAGALAKERFIKGNAKRLGQGKGPYLINFNKSDPKGRDIVTYFQIDGEFYRVEKPKSIIIRPCPLLPNGKVKVMLNSKKFK